MVTQYNTQEHDAPMDVRVSFYGPGTQRTEYRDSESYIKLVAIVSLFPVTKTATLCIHSQPVAHPKFLVVYLDT
jgi:hypothetical protein